jgi:hypothetical protein
MRLFLILLVAASLAVLSGCGGNDGSDSSTGAVTEGATTLAEPSTTTATTTTTESDDQGLDDGGSNDSSDSSDSSGGDDEETVAVAVTDFYGALVSGDGETACSLMSDSIKGQFTKSLAQAQDKAGSSCEDLVGQLAKSYPDQLRRRLDDLEVTKVTVDGDQATATVKLPGVPVSTLPLTRDGDSWQIEAPVGSTG